MASIPVSFEMVKDIWDEYIKNRNSFVCFIFPKGKFTWMGELMPMTFEDVAKIEALRRQIENLQVLLSKQSNLEFGTYNDVDHMWHTVGRDLQPVLRETLCKHTVVQITKLLDDAARLGVDVSTSKEVLLKVLEELKPKQE